ncbi:MAG TPA: AraC family transcriptional regulator, partial [Polyangiaceae bacterium]|nr:AraC family transcriptional regulator [Polyangiaceae bacterium]
AARLGGSGFPNVFSADRNPEITGLVKELDTEIWGNAPGRKAAIVGLLQVLLARVQRHAPPLDESSDDRHAAIHKVCPALAVIAGHYAESLDVADLAQACNLSETHFRRLFKAALRQSPAEYLARFRVYKASALLREERSSVVDAAFACGFNSLSAFSRQFAATFRVSPRAFRAKHRAA